MANILRISKFFSELVRAVAEEIGERIAEDSVKVLEGFRSEANKVFRQTLEELSEMEDPENSKIVEKLKDMIVDVRTRLLELQEEVDELKEEVVDRAVADFWEKMAEGADMELGEDGDE